MSTVIRVENLSKKYLLTHQQRESFPTLRDAIVRSAANFGRRLLHPLRASSGMPPAGLGLTEEFWALKDVSFDVNQGDRVGIIGRNGAGKSTLLKVLSRITEPTSGRAKIKGRVASLLEVGTGFHPELTGRENIFLNGAVLGMTRAEIRRKFDEIVAFAEVEKFLDTPVKRYSSGMYVRLAFAVAAHLEPEILIVDEVLAVGDAQFQKKCLGKMEEVGREGRTVLFVSHNMDAIRNLCNIGLLIESGSLKSFCEANVVLDEYFKLYNEGCNRAKWIKNQEDNNISILKEVTVRNSELIECSTFKNIDDIKIEFIYKQPEFSSNLRLVVTIVDSCDKIILTSSNYDLLADVQPGNNRFIAEIKAPLFAMGKYYVNVRFDVPNLRKYEVNDRCVSFDIVENEYHQMGVLGSNENLGCVHVPVFWIRSETISL